MERKFKKIFAMAITFLFAITIATTVSSGKIYSDLVITNEAGIELGEGPLDCYYQGSVFAAKSVTGPDCYCGLTWQHFDVFCDTQYYDACRIVMCIGDPCCHLVFQD